jgi:hypothetical protein
MTAEFLAAGSGLVLSLAFSYIPGLSKWYGVKDEDQKRLIMLGVLALFSLGIFGLACSGYGSQFGLKLTCNDAGAIELGKAFFAAVVANQVAYGLTPKSKSRAYGRGLA